MKHVFPIALVLVALADGGHCQDPPNPGPVVQEVIRAVGGEEKLLRTFRMKERYHGGEEPTPPAGKSPGVRESFLDAPGYWWINRKDRTDEPAKFDVWAWTLVALTDARSKVSVVPDVVEDGEPVLGLRISESITPPLELYFNQETKLLVRMDWRGDVYRFSEWREHDGVKYPARTVMFKKSTGKPWFYHEITELERLNELPADLPR